jgi:hypothetical protein
MADVACVRELRNACILECTNLKGDLGIGWRIKLK